MIELDLFFCMKLKIFQSLGEEQRQFILSTFKIKKCDTEKLDNNNNSNFLVFLKDDYIHIDTFFNFRNLLKKIDKQDKKSDSEVKSETESESDSESEVKSESESEVKGKSESESESESESDSESDSDSESESEVKGKSESKIEDEIENEDEEIITDTAIKLLTGFNLEELENYIYRRHNYFQWFFHKQYVKYINFIDYYDLPIINIADERELHTAFVEHKISREHIKNCNEFINWEGRTNQINKNYSLYHDVCYSLLADHFSKFRKILLHINEEDCNFVCKHKLQKIREF